MAELRIGIEARAFNATIRSRRQELGLTQRQLAAKAGVSVVTVNTLETFRRPGLTPAVRKVLGYLGLDDDASPEWIKTLELHGKRTIERSVTPELAGLSPLLALPAAQLGEDDTDDVLERVDRERIVALLEKLPRRERAIIERRFGIVPPFYRDPSSGTVEDGWTLEEIGHDLDLTRERVRQLEGQGLERLRKLVRGYGLGEIPEDEPKVVYPIGEEEARARAFRDIASLTEEE